MRAISLAAMCLLATIASANAGALNEVPEIDAGAGAAALAVVAATLALLRERRRR